MHMGQARELRFVQGEFAGRLAQSLGYAEHFFGAGADADVFSEIDPPDSTMGIEQKFSGPRDVVAVWTAPGVEYVVLANYRGIGIGEDLKRESGLAGEVARDFRRIDADRYGNDAGGLEFGKLLLDASQLEGAVGSPVAAIENQENGFRGGGTGGC
jgi:hypothetical protein